MVKYIKIFNSYHQGGFVLMFTSFLFNAIEGVIVGLISLPFVIVIHELGHLLFGRISGYQFISLRLLLFQWAKDENGKIHFTRVTSLLNMGGQCLMKPLHKEEDFTYKLYNLGGSLLNLITSVFLIFPLFFFGQTFTRWLFIAGVVSVFVAVANLIPSSSGGLPSDGQNVKEASKSKEAKRGFYVMLKANGEMALGKKLSELDEDLFKTNEDADVNNYFVAFTILLHAAYLEEIGKHQESYSQLLRLESANLPSIYRAQIFLGLLFNELIHQGDEEAKEKAQERWGTTEKDKDTIPIIETIKHPGFMIPYAAKVAILDKDITKANKLANEAKKLIPTLQNPGTEHLAQLNLKHLVETLPEIILEEGVEEIQKYKPNEAKEKSKETKTKEEVTGKEKSVIINGDTTEKKSYFPPPVIHPEEKLYVPPTTLKVDDKLYVPPITPTVEEKLYVPLTSSTVEEDEPYLPPTPSTLEEDKPYLPPISSIIEEDKPYLPPISSIIEEDKPYLPPISSIIEEDKPYLTPTPSTLEEDKPYLTPISSIIEEDKPYLTPISSIIEEEEDRPLSPAQIIENLTSEILGEISAETSENIFHKDRDKNFEDIMNKFKSRS